MPALASDSRFPGRESCSYTTTWAVTQGAYEVPNAVEAGMEFPKPAQPAGFDVSNQDE